MFMLRNMQRDFRDASLNSSKKSSQMYLQTIFFGKNGLWFVQTRISKKNRGHFWIFRGATHTIRVEK